MLDDCSRYALGLQAGADERTAAVQQRLERIFGLYGLPEGILCDNGVDSRAFAGNGIARYRFRSFHAGSSALNYPPMAKVYFYYAAMNAGKSTVLLQSSYNYRERGMRTLLFTPSIDTRYGTGRIESRIGLRSGAISLAPADNILNRVRTEHAAQPVACVLIDEAQFLTAEQAWQVSDVADTLEIPVLCYGLRTDFQGKLFPGSATLLGIADELSELKTICHCGRKATMNLRVDREGRAVREGVQVEIGGNDRYVAMCRRHFKAALAAAGTPHTMSPFPR